MSSAFRGRHAARQGPYDGAFPEAPETQALEMPGTNELHDDDSMATRIQLGNPTLTCLTGSNEKWEWRVQKCELFGGCGSCGG